MEIPKRNSCSILVVANDTGGAQILAALVRDQWAYTWTAAALPHSPADRLFRRYAPDCPVVDLTSCDPAVLLEEIQPDLLLVGTSLYNTELPLIREARKRGILAISVLDHWINYRERFGFPADNWRDNLPDIVCATDGVAVGLAHDAGFPRVEPLKNYYLADFLSTYAALPPAEERDLLLLSQVVPHEAGQVHGVHQAQVAARERCILKELIFHFEKLAGFLSIKRLVVRLHPAQPELLYSDLQDIFPGMVIEPATSCDLAHSLRRARIAVGCSSMALFTATALGKETYSFAADQREELPPVGRFLFESVEEIFTGKCTLSPFGHSTVYLDDGYGIVHLLQQKQHENNGDN